MEDEAGTRALLETAARDIDRVRELTDQQAELATFAGRACRDFDSLLRQMVEAHPDSPLRAEVESMLDYHDKMGRALVARHNRRREEMGLGEIPC